MIVCKFGGSSSACMKAVTNIKRLKTKNRKRKIFVFSAIGKSFAQDTKMTDLLLSLCKLSPQSEEYKQIKDRILVKFEKLLKDTGVKFDIAQAFEIAENKFAKTNEKAFLVSRGEFFTTQILAEYLGLKFVPAEEVIFFKNGKVDEEKTKQSLSLFLRKYKTLAIPGFYGVDENKKIKLLSRGGGDFSGAIISKLTNAKVYENWTDVNGIFQINPNFGKSKRISKLSYEQLATMTSMDANVIHEDCASYLSNAGVKLKISSCFSPNNGKTVVDNRSHPNVKFICFVASDSLGKIFVQNKNTIHIIITKPSNIEEVVRSEFKNL